MKKEKIDGAKVTGAVDFIISRKRKLYKFARFNELRSCFQLGEWVDFIKTHSNFLDKQPVVAEIGAGTAVFLVEQAKLSPEKIFVAVDVKSDRLHQGARKAQEEKVTNIYFVRSRVEELVQIFSSNSVFEIWLTFSDPYPRKSDAKHRLTYKKYLKLYQEILNKDGRLHFKTDSDSLFEYSLASFRECGWQILTETEDLHSSDLPEKYKVMTSYEARFVGEGKNIHFLTAKPE
ncbi:tRNA (guanosine(46)-N7)-methyltransferase TrmB [Candidatus Saccharibacteria bacterium]|nr:tRNA (guanosine(46)-N7)-methyltransferase TrmB [Candidatus Saccharibacteria bacterium]